MTKIYFFYNEFKKSYEDSSFDCYEIVTKQTMRSGGT